jgi:hypothetical protein
VLPIAWLSQHVQWRLVFSRAANVGLLAMLLSVAVLFATLFVGAWRWALMLRAYDADATKQPGILTLFRHYIVGQYFNVLPSGVAGDAVRGYRVQQCFRDPATSYVVLFVERIGGLLGLLTVAGIAAVASPTARGGPVSTAMNIGMLLALGAGAVVFALPQLANRSDAARKLLHAIPVAGPILRRIPPAQRIAPLLAALALSVLTQVGTVLAVATIVIPLSPAATVWACMRVVPPITLITYIPLTPGGLGQREAAFRHFFGLVHVDQEAALAASFLFFGAFLLTALTGGLVLLYERARGLG